MEHFPKIKQMFPTVYEDVETNLKEWECSLNFFIISAFKNFKLTIISLPKYKC